MIAEFYLFDVDHGQSAALRLPNGRWCIFDVGCSATFSPVQWIAGRESRVVGQTLLTQLLAEGQFTFLKATISHFHADHLDDYKRLLLHGPDYIRTTAPDPAYIADAMSSSTPESATKIRDFAQRFQNEFGALSSQPDYGVTLISELSLPVAVARSLGGSANSHVNNASVVTRIGVYGTSILICGDVEKEAWTAISSNPLLFLQWKSIISNVDILVAPHHGHSSGYSVDLMNWAKPAVVLVSVASRDPHVDSRYSQAPVRGIRIGDTEYGYISTRQMGHIQVCIEPPKTLLGIGTRRWAFNAAAVE